MPKSTGKLAVNPLGRKNREKHEKRHEQNSIGDRLFGIGLFIVVVLIAAATLLYGLAPAGEQVRSAQQSASQLYTLPPGDPTLSLCVSSNQVVMRLQVHLRIIINGTEIRIPARIGMTESCVRPVHTRDSSGTIYVESPVTYPYTLRDFFAVWNQRFSSNELFFLRADAAHKITMTINGSPNSDYENHVLSNGEQIVITYS